MKKIGVLTGGGDCPGLNAVIRAVVKSALFKHNIQVYGIRDGYEGLVLDEMHSLDHQEVSGILNRGGTILGTSNVANPFDYVSYDSQGQIVKSDRSSDVLKVFERNQLDGLVLIGGDGTQSIGLKLSKLGIPVVGVPKTIDNDLGCTDVTFGFDTALTVATEAVDRLHTTGESHKRVMVLEVMGRYAGWIALRSGIAGGGDVILIPEIPYELDKICDAIRKRTDSGKKFSIVVVAEGAKSKDGQMVVKQHLEHSPDPLRLGGVGEMLAAQIEQCSGLESRVTVLGHLQRGGSPTPYDRWLATRFGVKAVDLLLEGKYGQIVVLKGQNIEHVPIKESLTHLKTVDPLGAEVEIARAVGTSFGD